ncbi:TetR family transcriptional regulator [Longimycelium tulufanense]|uniref:TetR family transcriptional regulator n=1 Tax=Longimycelium tulufanense TaxID=907463 RepID=A0A8J3CE46_9PSEU|nr:TetR/AcrR family transcriptional regulator [Longimycelium tulufanense]GGM80295.1 TetR family transcriptional regulator [Longimycelium tulufanense]
MTERAARTYRGLAPEERRAERRERLLDAAMELFARDGYHATRIERLCTQAGVSTRNFYEEFDNKEAVLLALHNQINTEALAEVDATLADVPDDVIARIEAILTAILRNITADPRKARVAYVEAAGTSPAVEAQHREWVLRWTALIEREAERAVQAGLAPPGDYHTLGIALTGAATELLRQWQAQPEPGSPAPIAEALRRLVFGGFLTQR